MALAGGESDYWPRCADAGARLRLFSDPIGNDPSVNNPNTVFFKRLDQFTSVFMGVKTKPFQFVQILGVVAVGVSGLGFVIALARRAAQADGDLGLRVLVSIGLGLWGFLTVVTGTIGEYIVGMNHEIGRHPKYLVRKVHE